MKRIATLLLALCLLLPACGKAVPEQETTATKASTQPPITELTWRVIPTDDAMKAGIAAWREEQSADRPLGELKLSQDKTVILERGWSRDGSFIVSSTILLRDEAGGSETVLMEHNNPNYSTSTSRSPVPVYALDERYIVISWDYYESAADCSVFDIQEKRDIPVEGTASHRFLAFAGGFLYFVYSPYDPEYYNDPLQIRRIALWALLEDNSLAASDAIIDAETGYAYPLLISPEGRYLATEKDGSLLVYELERGRQVLRIPPPEGAYHFNWPHFMDDHTLYFYDHTDDGAILEITLP